MTPDGSVRIGVFGIGEAGSEIARDLAGSGADVKAFDPADVLTPEGVSRVEEPSDAVKGRELILAITAATDAQRAIAQAWDQLPRGAIYADLSTAPPTLKEDLSDTATLRGLLFVDVALMGTVPRNGLATPAYASGSGAEDFARLLNEMGGNVEVVGVEPGLAAARKLLRSIVTKGLTSAVLEAMEGASRLDLDTWMWGHIIELFEGLDRAMLERLMGGTGPHIERRVVEMDSVASLLESVDVPPLMTRASGEVLKRVRDGKLRPQG